MEYNEERVDEAVLALLWLTMFEDQQITRAWKNHDWNSLDRLHSKGFIADPKSKAKSVVVTEAGKDRARELFQSCSAPTSNKPVQPTRAAKPIGQPEPSRFGKRG